MGLLRPLAAAAALLAMASGAWAQTILTAASESELQTRVNQTPNADTIVNVDFEGQLTGQILINPRTASLTIQSHGGRRTLISSPNYYRHFFWDNGSGTGVNLTFRDITLAGGSGNFGGIANISVGPTTVSGLLTLNNVIIENCKHPLPWGGEGGGVYWRGNVYVTNGSQIKNNECHNDSDFDRSGGGVYATGTFTMDSGSVSGNKITNNGTGAAHGGGVYAGGAVTFSGIAAISDNFATSDGGGIWSGGVVTINSIITVSGNTAGGNGGGVYATVLGNVRVGPDPAFSGNSVPLGYNRDPSDDADYNNYIHCTSWSSPFTQGYNNYDIAYTGGTIYSPFDGGDGTEQSPYLISDWKQLRAIDGYLDKWFKLANDLNPADGVYTTGTNFYDIVHGTSAGWVPIGTVAKPFKGHFDGTGKTIRGYWVNVTDPNEHAGLFGSINGGNVKSLNLVIHPNGVKYTRTSGVETNAGKAGGLVGEVYVISGSAVMENITVSGGPVWGYNSSGGIFGSLTMSGSKMRGKFINSSEVTSVNFDAGGIVGDFGGEVEPTAGGTVLDNYGAVNGTAYAGGIFGFLANPHIPTVFDGQADVTKVQIKNSGKVKGIGSKPATGFGGVIGCIVSSPVTIQNYVNTVDVECASGKKGAGGIVGWLMLGGTVQQCYNTGTITADSNAGGIVGTMWTPAVVQRVYNLGVVKGDWSGGLVGSSDGVGILTSGYNAGRVLGNNCGAVIGSLPNPVITPPTNLFYDKITSGIADAAPGVTELTTDDLTAKVIPAGLTSGNNYWTTGHEGLRTYPYFPWQLTSVESNALTPNAAAFAINVRQGPPVSGPISVTALSVTAGQTRLFLSGYGYEAINTNPYTKSNWSPSPMFNVNLVGGLGGSATGLQAGFGVMNRSGIVAFERASSPTPEYRIINDPSSTTFTAHVKMSDGTWDDVTGGVNVASIQDALDAVRVDADAENFAAITLWFGDSTGGGNVEPEAGQPHTLDAEIFSLFPFTVSSHHLDFDGTDWGSIAVTLEGNLAGYQSFTTGEFILVQNEAKIESKANITGTNFWNIIRNDNASELVSLTGGTILGENTNYIMSDPGGPPTFAMVVTTGNGHLIINGATIRTTGPRTYPLALSSGYAQIIDGLLEANGSAYAVRLDGDNPGLYVYNGVIVNTDGGAVGTGVYGQSSYIGIWGGTLKGTTHVVAAHNSQIDIAGGLIEQTGSGYGNAVAMSGTGQLRISGNPEIKRNSDPDNNAIDLRFMSGTMTLTGNPVLFGKIFLERPGQLSVVHPPDFIPGGKVYQIQILTGAAHEAVAVADGAVPVNFIANFAYATDEWGLKTLGNHIVLDQRYFDLTVVNGSGSGSYTNLHPVEITADPAATGYVFDYWSITSGGGSLANANNASTTYTMPNNAATVTANYKAKDDIVVTFNGNRSDDAPDPASKTVTYMAKYGKLADVLREDWLFMGWLLETDFITAASDVETADNHEVGAVWFRPNGNMTTDDDKIGDIDFPDGTSGTTNGAPVTITINGKKYTGTLRGPKGGGEGPGGEFEIILDDEDDNRLPPGGGDIEDITINEGDDDDDDEIVIILDPPITISVNAGEVNFRNYVRTKGDGRIVGDYTPPEGYDDGELDGFTVTIWIDGEEYEGYLVWDDENGVYNIFLNDDEELPSELIGTTVDIAVVITDGGGKTLFDNRTKPGEIGVIGGIIDIDEALTLDGSDEYPIADYTPPFDYEGDLDEIIVDIYINGNKYKGRMGKDGRIYLVDDEELGLPGDGPDQPIVILLRDPETGNKIDRARGEIDIFDDAEYGKSRHLLITAITVYKDGGEEWVSVTVSGCVNYSKRYGLFGHGEEISKKLGGVSENAHLSDVVLNSVPALDETYEPRPKLGKLGYQTLGDGGVHTFDFKKPASDRFFFHARQMD